VAERGAGPVGFRQKGGPFWTKFPGSTSGQSRASVEIAGKGHTHYQWSDEERTRRACEWLREKSTFSERPFAAVIGYVLPHCPFVAPKELFDYYYDKTEIPEIEDNQPATITRYRKMRGILEPPLPPERIRVARAAYYGLCEYIDSLIGKVLDTLDETGLSKDTVVIYTSDHGEQAGEHGCWWKSNYYEGSAGVPMIMRWPGVIEPGTVSRNVCNLMDLGPSLAEIAGTSFPYEVDGHSLLRIMTEGDDPDWVDETTSELADFRGGYFPSRMIRSGPWKLWVYGDDENLPPALFNLDDDPNEKNDLAFDPQYDDIRTMLLEKVYAGWDPKEVITKSKLQWNYFDLLAKWGKSVEPDAPYAMVYPSDEYESDVELL
ncbi:MAG: sulfatase-like hydrolase/transferase, partial [Clostridia bacterium]|nr:sulfatase-like hydrolase/transferase [Clostridia bacterium]